MDPLLRFFASVALSAACMPMLHAQAIPTATERSHIQVGAGFLLLNNDYTVHKNEGITLFGDYDFLRHVGIEADAHLGGIRSPDNTGENSYLAGPRLLYRRNRADIYLKGLFGRASISNQDTGNFNRYNVYGTGGGLEYLLRPNIDLHFDIEQQFWPNFEPNTLAPLLTTVGVAYVIR